MHGPTFMANPLACAVANASLTLLQQTPWQQKVRDIEATLAETLPALLALESVKSVRWLGAIGVVETHSPVNVEAIQRHFVAKGVWIRPFGRLVYIMPPYDVSAAQLKQLVDAIAFGLGEVM